MATATRKSDTAPKAGPAAKKPAARGGSKAVPTAASKANGRTAPAAEGKPAAKGRPATAAGGTSAAKPAAKPKKSSASGSRQKPAAKLVKGRFSMPRDDYALLAVLKERAAASGAKPRKNDLLRAGLHALMESGRVELRRALDRLPPDGKRRSQSGG